MTIDVHQLTPEGHINDLPPLSTQLVEGLELHERNIVIKELENQFPHIVLKSLLFYKSLISGRSQCYPGTTKCHDVALADLINHYPVPYSKERLLKYFHIIISRGNVVYLDPHVFVGNPYEPLSSDDLNLKKFSVVETSPKLDVVFPTFEEQTLNTDELNIIKKSRQRQLDNYLSDLDGSRGSHPRLKSTALFQKLSETLNFVTTQNNTLFCVDIEAYEHQHDFKTEIGIAIYDPAKSGLSLQPTFHNFHIMIQENIHLRNGAKVPDHKPDFLGGPSIILPLERALELIQCLIDYYFIHRVGHMGLGCLLAGHAVDGDLKWLRELGIRLPKKMNTVDTQDLYRLVEGPVRGFSLGWLLGSFAIQHSKLHNGGNDAYYTLVLLLKMCDPQFRREKGMDNPETSRRYNQMLEQWRSGDRVDHFEGSKPSPPERSFLCFESVPPLKLTSCSAALQEMFGLNAQL